MKHPRLLSLSTQMKAGRGLTIVSSVLEGTYMSRGGAARTGEQVGRRGGEGVAEVTGWR